MKITVSCVWMSVKDFCESHDMSAPVVNARLDCGDLPEIEKEADSGKRYVNMVLLAEWAAQGKVVLSDLKKLKESEA